MNKQPVETLKVIEIPYDETKPMWRVFFKEEGGKNKVAIESYLTCPSGRRELDDYKQCGVYLTSGVPFEIEAITCIGEKKPHEEQIRNISKLASNAIKAHQSVLMVGGGCSHAIGMVGGIQQALGKDKKIGFIWLDAHGDINTPESTESGLLGGTPLAVIAGLCHGEAYDSWIKAAGILQPLKQSDIILSDGRDLDSKEAEVLQATEIVFLNTESFNNPAEWENVITDLANRVDAIYLHIDGDILDGKYTPGQYTAESGGPEVEAVMRNIQIVMNTDKVIAFSLVSLFHENDNPYKELCTLSGIRLLASGLQSWKFMPTLM